ncbi:LysR family transcriptional regulator [Mucilaginibacter pallidiroseus]|uniref:LysR family transcriptional regulator n=1 Tax=Mucilaginibacter pallidiroseus TaxID=2599295 RepID=A0A563U1P7_9SPHI|nr:LysR substrate-binding domain-containing protein [Mucilaginibacter pallidiroseus]TWR24369.1 LysR family transcriptional regulator [Mucilaginibacter pallidiroseus]
MELRQLRYFVRTKDLGSFTEASRSLNITQSTLSQQVKQLEDELGVLLFDRFGKRITVTEAGELFYQFAAESLKKANDGAVLLKDLSDMHTGTLKIGVTYGLRNLFTAVLIKFSERFPGISVRAVFGTSDELMEKVRSYELDLALIFFGETEHESLAYDTLFSSPMALVCADDSHFKGNKTVSLKDIAALPLAIATKEHSADHYFLRLFQKHRLKSDFKMEINDISAVLDLVRTGRWYSIMVEVTVRNGPLHTIPIKEKNLVRKAAFVRLSGAYEKKAAKEFAAQLRRQLPELT